MIKNNKNIILKDRSISEAIKLLNQVKHKTLVVVNRDKKLFGTLTDGDIRRGILKGHDLKTKVGKIAFTKPKKIINKRFSKFKNKENANLIPCIDKYGRVKSVEFFNSNYEINSEKQLDIILMAGGFGKRLLPLTRNTPKPLLKINNKTLLEIAIDNFKKYGFKKFNISIFYKSKIIKNYFKKKKFDDLKINYIEEKKPLGTAGCLALLNYKKIKNDVLVFNGDVITDLNINNFLKFHYNTKSDITVCAKEFSNSSPFGEIIFSGSKIRKIVEKPHNKNFINAGIYLIKKKMLKNIQVKKIDMTSFIDIKIKQGHHINIYPVYEYWVDVGRKETFKQILKQRN